GALIALQRHLALIRWSLWRGSHSESCDIHYAIRAKLEPHQVTCGVQMALGVRSQRLSQTQQGLPQAEQSMGLICLRPEQRDEVGACMGLRGHCQIEGEGKDLADGEGASNVRMVNLWRAQGGDGERAHAPCSSRAVFTLGIHTRDATR